MPPVATSAAASQSTAWKRLGVSTTARLAPTSTAAATQNPTISVIRDLPSERLRRPPALDGRENSALGARPRPRAPALDGRRRRPARRLWRPWGAPDRKSVV